MKKDYDAKIAKEKHQLSLKANSPSPVGDLADQKLSLRQENEEKIY